LKNAEVANFLGLTFSTVKATTKTHDSCNKNGLGCTFLCLQSFPESTAPLLGTSSWTDVAFGFMPGAGHPYQVVSIALAPHS
jgi:hypothetical protein